MDEQLLAILVKIKAKPGINLYELCDEVSIKRTTLQYQLRKLITANLIRVEYKDKKATYYLSSLNEIQEFIKNEVARVRQQFNDLITVDFGKQNVPIREKLKLAVANYYDFIPEYRKELEQNYDIIDYSTTELYIDQSEFVRRCKDADVILSNWACSITDQVVAQLPKLQYLHVSTHMYRYVDLEALRSRGIHFSHIRENYKVIAVTEFMLAQTFFLLRNISDASREVKSGVKDFKYFMGEQLRGKTVGIIGTNEISFQLVQALKNLGTNVLVYSESSSDSANLYGLTKFSTAQELFESCDILYNTATGDSGTKLASNLTMEFLGQLSRPVYYISIQKHASIDFDLIRDLKYKGILKGIALDNMPEFQVNRLGITKELRKILYLPNVIITPDIAWYTDGSVQNMNQYSNRNLIAYLRGDTSHLLF